MATAARPAASWSRSRSSAVKLRWTRLPTWSTPRTRSSASSGTPSRERMPFSRRIGLRMSAWSTSSMAIARRSAAMRPAKPLPTGICTPRSTSSSMPLAARARSVVPVSSISRIAAVSESRISLMRSSSSLQQLVLRQVRQRRIRDTLQRLEPWPVDQEPALGVAVGKPRHAAIIGACVGQLCAQEGWRVHPWGLLCVSRRRWSMPPSNEERADVGDEEVDGRVAHRPGRSRRGAGVAGRPGPGPRRRHRAIGASARATSPTSTSSGSTPALGARSTSATCAIPET